MKFSMHMAGRTLFLSAVISAMAGGYLYPQQKDDRVIVDFESRVKQYTDLLKSLHVDASSTKPTGSAEKIVVFRHEAAAKVRAARAAAKQGDIFTPPIAERFRKLLAATLAGPEGAKIEASLRRAEPVKGDWLAINATYPQGIPLQSTPPTLLLNLPPLPKELEYRIVDSSLILMDVQGGIVADYIPEALPEGTQ